MRELYQVVKEMNIYTKQGVDLIEEAYNIVNTIDKGLTKEGITILTNFADEFPYEFKELMREKERVMHGIRI